jgi:phosphomannomutase/phosphoglucomutase
MIGGESLYGEGIQAIYHIAQKKLFQEGAGSYKAIDISTVYIAEILKNINLNFNIKKLLKVVVDAGSGVAGNIAPVLLTALGCEVIPLYCEVDGAFPYHHPDPGQPKNLADLITAVKYHDADIGVAFDGDGDRLGVVTNKGEIIWSDNIMMLFSQAVLAQCKEKQQENNKNNIIFDVKCSANLPKIIAAAGGNPIMSATGHSLIKAKIRETNAILAGEMSGHFFFNDRWYGFDDGLYAAARLLEILSNFSGDMAMLAGTLPHMVSTPEINITVGDREKFEIINKLQEMNLFPENKIIIIDGLRVEFTDGWGLVRASNTTPCLVLRFEANTAENLDKIQKIFKNNLLQVKNYLHLTSELVF